MKTSPPTDLAADAAKIASPYARHLGIFNPHKHDISATIIGCGAVGSFVAVGLAKMGIHRQTLYDFDTVERENIAVQMHRKDRIGQNKAVATLDMIGDLCPEAPDVQAYGDKWEGQSIKSDIVVAAVDSLPVRKAIWESVKYDPTVKLLVDARIGGQLMKIYAVSPSTPKDIEVYDKSFPKGDMEGSELPCTERGVIDISLFSAAFLIRSVRRFIVTGKKETYRVANFAGEIPNIM